MFPKQSWHIILNSATPLMEIQREALILGNNMSSGVTVPIFGKNETVGAIGSLGKQL